MEVGRRRVAVFLPNAQPEGLGLGLFVAYLLEFCLQGVERTQGFLFLLRCFLDEPRFDFFEDRRGIDAVSAEVKGQRLKLARLQFPLMQIASGSCHRFLRLRMKMGSGPLRTTPLLLLRFEHLAGLLQFGKLALLMGEFLAHLDNFLFLLADLFEDNLDRGLLDPGLSAPGLVSGGCWFLRGHNSSLGLWVGCEGTGLLRKQEQETAHGADLAFDTIEPAKSGAMGFALEIVCDGRKPDQEICVYRLDPFENSEPQFLVDVTRPELFVGFLHLVFPLLWT